MQPFIERALMAKAAEMMDEEFSIHAARMLASATSCEQLADAAKKASEFVSFLNELENSAKLS